MRKFLVGVVVAVALVGLGVQVASAQTRREKYWGVGVAFVPKFEVNENVWLKDVAPYFLRSGDLGMDIEAADFRVGFVRGASLRGDFGVSYVRRTFKEGSTQGGFDQSCPPPGSPGTCLTFGEEYTYQDVVLNGFEVHKFAPFVTIKERVQVGVEFGGGIGQYSGSAIRVSRSGSGNPTTAVVEARELNELADNLKIVPLFRLELAVAGILPGGLKVKGSGGVNFPGQHTFSVSVIYLFEPR